MDFRKAFRLALLAFMIQVSDLAWAQEKINFELKYSANNGKAECENLPNKTFFVKSGNLYRFQVAFGKASSLGNGSSDFSKDWEVRIYSFSDLADSADPVKVYSWKSVVRKLKSLDDQNHGFAFSLTPPAGMKNHANFGENPPPYYAWNLALVVYDKGQERPVATRSYSLTVLPTDFRLYSKINGSSKYYAYPALPDSGIFDNSHGRHPLQVEHSIRNSKNYSNYKGMGLSTFGTQYNRDNNIFDFSNFGIIHSSNNGLGLSPSIPRIPLLFFFLRSKNKSENFLVESGNTLRDRFTLLPGETGMIFWQNQVEESDYVEYGPDKCGLLAGNEVVSKKIFTYTYSMVLVDRDRITEENYLEDLGNKYLPAFSYSENP